MGRLLAESRIPVSLVPERLIVDAARDQGVRLDQLAPAERDAALEEPGIAGRVLESAIERWRELAASWVRLDFTMQNQSQRLWCWAATTVSVSAYYDPQSEWTQCAMVNAEKGLATCCEDGSSDECDQTSVLDAPLRRADVLDHKQRGPVGYDLIRREIDAGRPLAFRVRWSGGGGHFAVIEGCQSLGDEWIAVEDPEPGYTAVDLSFSTLTAGMYRGRGSWTHSYFTRPQSIRPLEPDEVRAALDFGERVPGEDSAVVGDGR
jgi:Papain-like cysteine protease AvrRpt2